MSWQVNYDHLEPYAPPYYYPEDEEMDEEEES